ncbi:MAG: hypothetical protein IJ314_02175 [Bacteroidales bacterium]|nr:hypothetical protein [Bacteroidales bacterium]
MKLRSLFASILASVALIGCVQEEFPALSNIEVTPSYFTLGVDGGTKEVKVTSAAAWEITDTLPSWLSVSTLKGNGSKDGEAVTVTVAASTDTLARTAYLKFTSGKETQLVTVNQDAFIPDFPEFKAGDYWIVFEKGAALPLSSAYGYLYTAPVKEGEDGSITGAANNIFTFKAVEGGFTIQDPAGQYYCMQGTYDSFNVYAELPETGGVWTIKQTGKTTYEVANAANGKVMQYDPNYTSAGAYSSERGIYPNLVKVEIVPEPEPLGESMKIEDALEYKPELVVEGLVTATSTKGVILTDKSGSLYIHEINSKVALGDSIKVSGKLDVYNKGYQLTDPYQYELVDSVKHEVKYPKAEELTKTTLPEMVKKDFLAQYVSVKGIVDVDSYNNAIITVGGSKVKTYRSADSYADLKGKAYEFTGYLISYNEQYKEASLMVTNVSEELKDFVPEPEEPEQTPGGGEPEPTYPTIAEVIAAEDGDAVQTSGLVVATYTRGALIKDDTNYILAYYKPGLEVKVGDVIAVSGVKATYGGMAQIAADEDNEVPVVAEVLSSDNEVVHPAPTVLAGETFDAQLESKTVSYIEYTGTLSVSGYYYNVNVEGASKATVSLAYLNAEAFPAATNNAKVKVKGYYIGVSSSKYVNTMTVSVEAVN